MNRSPKNIMKETYLIQIGNVLFITIHFGTFRLTWHIKRWHQY